MNGWVSHPAVFYCAVRGLALEQTATENLCGKCLVLGRMAVLSSKSIELMNSFRVLSVVCPLDQVHSQETMFMKRPVLTSYRQDPLRVLALAGLFLLGSTLAPAPAWAQDDADVANVVPGSVEQLRAIQDKVTAVVEKAAPATVCVRAGGGSGSGVIISEDGYVLTAGHVIGEPGRRVTFVFPDGSTARGESLGLNVGIDSGLAKITDEGPWPYVEMGDLEDIKVGTWVVAMGHPGGFDAQRPVVTRLGRVYRMRDNFVQTDCTIIGGDSGGPLFDLEGRVIGIHSRISVSLRQNYHVPITTYTETWDRLAAGEVWNRPSARRGGPQRGGPYIGVQGQLDRNGAVDGATLGQVYPDTPAAQAGLQQGDIVIAIEGQKVASFGDLAAIVGESEPGDELTFMIKRGEREMEIELTVGRRE